MLIADETFLEIYVGDSSPIYLELYESRDEILVLAGTERLTFYIEDGAGTVMMSFTTSGGGITISELSNVVTIDMLQPQADALVPGRYVAQLALEFMAGEWRYSSAMDINVKRRIAQPIIP